MNPAIQPAVYIVEECDQTARAAAKRVAGILKTTVAERGICRIALAGGDTPRPVYELLASGPDGRGVDWSRIHLYFTDERMVPPDHPSSNYRMVWEALISRIPIPEKRVHRIAGELEPSFAAAAYAGEVSSGFDGGDPRFDLVLLGIGEDGHTASLFPGTDVLGEDQALVREVYVPHLKSTRVTMTFVVLNAAQRIIFLATGLKKAPAVAAVIGRSDPRMPASLIRPADGRVEWFLDRAAARHLTDTHESAPGNPVAEGTDNE